MRVWKQWTDEHRTTRKIDSGRRKVTSARNDQHLLCMVVNDRAASSGQLAARWSIAACVLMSASSIRRRLLHRGLRARVPLYRIPLTANIDGCICNGLMSTEPGKLIGTKFFQINHASICVTMIAAMPVSNAFQSALSNDILRRTPGVMVWGVISYHGRTNFLRIEGDLNSNRYVCEVLQPEVVLFL
ncbi:transposable element Tc1 transposase [Trichonephila clavipes]|uniref:Transposable element Tc1 transposase n=1 Tax=Trichonephila clavipes TaxID=2585209 RepID=A0A8X6R3G1_TRICX|nr:transposable element Tc1 transposase [Trichonephila clavipes]